MRFDEYQRVEFETVQILARFLPVVGSGVYRTVYALGPSFVLKVSRYGENEPSLDVDHNIREARVWSKADDRMRQSLVPVLDWGPGWLVMPLVLTLVEGGVAEQAMEDMEARLPMWEDKKLSNIGVHEAKFKLLDYADLWEAMDAVHSKG